MEKLYISFSYEVTMKHNKIKVNNTKIEEGLIEIEN